MRLLPCLMNLSSSANHRDGRQNLLNSFYFAAKVLYAPPVAVSDFQIDCEEKKK